MFASSGRPRCTTLRHRAPMTQHARCANSMTYHTGMERGWRHTRASAGFTILVPGFWIQQASFLLSHKRGVVREAAQSTGLRFSLVVLLLQTSAAHLLLRQVSSGQNDGMQHRSPRHVPGLQTKQYGDLPQDWVRAREGKKQESPRELNMPPMQSLASRPQLPTHNMMISMPGTGNASNQPSLMASCRRTNAVSSVNHRHSPAYFSSRPLLERHPRTSRRFSGRRPS